MFYNLLRVLFSRHFQAIFLFVAIFGFVSILDLSPVRTKACPHIIRTISPAGDLLAGWSNGIVNVYQTESLNQIASFNHPGAYNVLPGKFSKNSQYLVTTGEATSPKGHQSYPLYIWNIKAQQKPIIIPGDGRDQSYAFSSDSTRLVAADDYRGKSSEKTRYTLGIWNVETGERLHELVAGHQALIIHADWSPDGTRIATASMDGTVRLWDATTGLEIKCLQPESKEGGFRQAAFSSNGKTVIGWCENDKLISWDAETGLVKSSLSITGHYVSFQRHTLDRDIVVRMYPVEWTESFAKKYDKWLPEWSKRLLQRRRFLNDIYDYHSETGTMTKMMTLTSINMGITALPGAEELITFDYANDPQDRQLAWYSLDQSFNWLRPLTWGVFISLSYWLLLSLFAWRRRSKLKPQSTG